MNNDEIKQLRKEHQRYEYVIESVKDVIWEMNINFTFTFISPSAKETTGYEPEELVGRSMLDFLAQKSRKYIVEVGKQLVPKRLNGNTDPIFLYDVEFICKSGRIIWFEISAKPIFNEDDFIGYIGTSRDITEKKIYEIKLKKYIDELNCANKKLERLATLDMLTGAYNRRKCDTCFNLLVREKENHRIDFSIIMFDVDKFKRINDLYGHKMGDQVLQGISKTIKYTIRNTDKLIRWGGEEFIILLTGTTLKNAYQVAEKIRINIELNKSGIIPKHITISLGVGEYRLGENLDQFVSRVDKALLGAKANGRNRTELS